MFRDAAVGLTVSSQFTRIATLSLAPGVYAVNAKTEAFGSGNVAIRCQLRSTTGDYDVAEMSIPSGASMLPMQLVPASGSGFSVYVECRLNNGSGSVTSTKITAIRLTSASNVPVNG